MPIRRTAPAVAFSILLLWTGVADAQGWQEYAYPEAGFAATFPAEPKVSDIRYRAGDIDVPARLYAAHLGSSDYSVTVADMSAGPGDGTAAVAAAVQALSALGEVRTNVIERIDRQFGREVSLTGRDGGQITTAVFFSGKKLYVLAGRTERDASGLAVRFQQSLQFIDADGKPPRRPEDGAGFGVGRPVEGEAGEGHGVAGEGPPPGQDPPGQRGRPRPPVQAFADCRGKAEGEAVQHQTPRGDVVTAICVSTPEGLAARPDRPPAGPSQGEREGG